MPENPSLAAQDYFIGASVVEQCKKTKQTNKNNPFQPCVVFPDNTSTFHLPKPVFYIIKKSHSEMKIVCFHLEMKRSVCDVETRRKL